jgi:hypothetical protein
MQLFRKAYRCNFPMGKRFSSGAGTFSAALFLGRFIHDVRIEMKYFISSIT